MKKITRFSIVAPNWNEMPHFTYFLDSLVSQTFKDFEVIIVDGGSTDSSISEIRKFKDKLDIKCIIDETHNIGYIRNVGSIHSKGDIIFQTSSDVVFPFDLLQKINEEFIDDPELMALGGRTKPIGNIDWLAKLAYWGFDHLRWLFTLGIIPLKHRKMRPAGNFLCIYRELLRHIGGYPNAKINEDGLLGYRIDEYGRESGLRAKFSRTLGVDHYIKRFEKNGTVKSLIFYSYVLANMFPMLEPLFRKRMEKSADIFSTRSDLEEPVKEIDD